MKKIILLLIGILINFPLLAAWPTDAGEYQVNIPLLKSGFEVGARGLYVRFTEPQMDYALDYPDTILSGGGRYRSARPNHDFGYEIFLGYIYPCSGANLRLTYSEFEQQVSNNQGANGGILLPSLSVPIFSVFSPGLNGDVLLTNGVTSTTLFNIPLISPGNVIFASPSVLQAQVKHRIRQGSLDFDAGQYINIDNFMRLRLFAGLRYSRVKNEVIATYLLVNPIGFTQQPSFVFVPDFEGVVGFETTEILTSTGSLEDIVNQTSKFEGIGPRFGAEGSFHLGGGFGLVGGLSTALLVGRQQSSLSQVIDGEILVNVLEQNVSVTSLTPGIFAELTGLEDSIVQFPAQILSSENYTLGSSTRIVPNIEAKIGLNYTFPLRHCRFIDIEIGYLANYYFNAVDRLTAIPPIFTVLNPVNTLDVAFSGPYLEIKATL